MNLFFETSRQADLFLLTVPLGFCMALCLDGGRGGGLLRLLLDLAVLLLAGVSIVFILMIFGEERLRLYHLLGIVTGAALYLQGVGKLMRILSARRRRKTAEKKAAEAGIPADTANT